MTRQDFDTAFRPMCQALNVKVTSTQADYFYQEFRVADQRDFAHACRELAMGNPGYLPRLDFFRENVAAAKEMRLATEKPRHQIHAEQWFHTRPSDPTGPHDDIFAKCCHAIITKHKDEAVVFVEKKLQDDAFRQWLTSWSTKSGLLALDWLHKQIEDKKTRIPVHLKAIG